MFTPEMLLLDVGFLLLGLAVIAPQLHHVRLIVGAAALAWLVRALLLGDMASAAWTGALLALCLIMAGRNFLSDAAVRFSDDEKKMFDALFAICRAAAPAICSIRACG